MKRSNILKSIGCLTFALLGAYGSQAQAINLYQAVEQTVQSNPDVFIKLKGWMAAQQGIDVAKGGYYPKVDLTATRGSNSTEDQDTNYTTDHFTPAGVDVTMSQMLFDGFATKYEVNRNVNRAIAESYQVQGTADEVALLAIKSYLDVLRTKKIIEYAQTNYNDHLNVYDIILRLSKQGLAREADATQAYGRVALAKANVLAAQNNYQNAEDTYFRVIGLKATALEMPKDPQYPMPQNEQSAIRDAVNNHPLIKAAKADVEEAKAQHEASRAINFPRLDAILSASDGSDMNNLEKHNEEYAAMLKLKYNLFNGGSDFARQRQTAYLIEEAEQTRNRTYDQVVENMQLAWNFLTTNQLQLTYFKTHKDAARATVTAYTQQFSVGKRTLLDVLDAEDESFNADTDYLNGQYNIMLSKYRILSAKGTLLKELQIPIPNFYAMKYRKALNTAEIQPASTKLHIN